MIVSTTAILLELAQFCSMYTLQFCDDILHSWGQIETPGLVLAMPLYKDLGKIQEIRAKMINFYWVYMFRLLSSSEPISQNTEENI